MTSTNYFDTLIEVAEDCRASEGEIPPVKNDKQSVANLQFEMLAEHPYEYTSDDVFFTVFAMRKGFPKAQWPAERERFFSKGQPCFRASPLTKRYGWGVHSDAEGRVALYGCDSAEYRKFIADDAVVKKKAMRSKRA